MARYPVTLEDDDNGTVLVSFPDFPEAHTFGEDKADAVAHAVDALETIVMAYAKDGKAIPEPSEVTAESVELPALAATKAQLYAAMRQQRMKKATLAKRLGVHRQQVDRLFDVKHASRLDQMEAAASALGGTLTISLNLPVKTATTWKRVRERAKAERAEHHVHAGALAAHKKRRSVKRSTAVGKKK